ncbi:MAG: NapC/NirT family cytochrome c [Phycisphaerales bacterium]|nr:NapC/NirT family cytochrome c [Phycisphaerales bacterium]MCB9864124.1 NapC/NirT family cytochrome c [Phycisphaerales bacterium]
MMAEDDTGAVESTTTGNEATPAAEGKSTGGEQKPRGKWRARLRVAGLFLLVFVVMGAVGVGGAEYYTGTPNFCGTCHVMDPYYESWSADIHGRRLDVRCVDCHYAPGERHTFMAKFKGLSQAVSYFSGRSGGSRPRAHVSDASCLTSKCHGDGGFKEMKLEIGERRTEIRDVAGQEVEIERKPTVVYQHKVHLDVEEKLAENERQLKAVSDRLKQSLPDGGFELVAAASKSVKPATARKDELLAVVASLGATALKDDAMELMRLEHMRVRLDQLDGLTCAACHGYNEGGDSHFKVNQSSCFTCHFTNQAFNQETGTCLKCHEPPSRMIAVHGAVQLSGATPTTANSSTGMMDHRDIIRRGIDCASCHLDVVQGDATVSARECRHCHDQDRFTKDFEHRTTETVEEYHRVHVAAQSAQCGDCHRAIVHRLVDPVMVASSTAFLEPVVNDCQHCHPNHHREQVELLKGTGGEGVAEPMPNAMFGSRMNCRGCHTKSGEDFKGDPLVKATETTCVACHSEDYRDLFRQWIDEIKTYTDETEASLTRVEARMAELTAMGKSLPRSIDDAVSEAKFNLHLVKTGNGVHNKHYAMQLLDLSIRGLDNAMLQMSEH